MFVRKIINLFATFCSESDYEPVKYSEMFLDDRIFYDHYYPDKDYILTLQLAFSDALKEIDSLKHQINQSAAITILKEAEETRSKYATALRNLAIVDADREKLRIMNEFYKERMEELSGKISAKDACKHQQQDKAGLFQSKTGMSKAENIAQCGYLAECGFSEADIAERLGLSAGTIKTYIATAKGHYKVEHDSKGDYVMFDDIGAFMRFYLPDNTLSSIAN